MVGRIAGVLTAALVLLPASAQAAVTVVTVPQDGRRPNGQPGAVPHLAYNGHKTTLKAIARGFPDLARANAATFAWDPEGDGTYEAEEALRQCVSGTPEGTNCYDLGKQVTLPNQATTTTLTARVRVTIPSESPVSAEYPVQVHPDVPTQTDPLDNGTARPQNATDRQMQVMRSVAVDDALWYLHKQMINRGGQSASFMGDFPTTGYGDNRGMFIKLAAENRHRAAYPPGTYEHGQLAPQPVPAGFLASNDARYRDDPYAETAMRAVNRLLADLGATGVPAADEADDGTNPIPGTNDLFGLGVCFGLACGQMMAKDGEAIAGLAASGLAGTTTQAGDANRVLNRTFEHIVQQLVDFVVFAQNESGVAGSYYYIPNTSNDFNHENIVSGPLLALRSAAAMAHAGVYVNQLVRGRLANYLNSNISATTKLAKSFNSQSNCGHYAETAHVVGGMALYGAGSGATNDTRLLFPGAGSLTRGQARVTFDRALDGLATNWDTMENDTCFNWVSGLFAINMPNPYLRTDGRANINALLGIARGFSFQPNPADFDTFAGHQWRREFSVYMIRNQGVGGNWAETAFGSGIMPSQILYMPVSTAAYYTDALMLAGRNSSYPLYTPSAQADVASISFDQQPVGTVSAPRTLTITNPSLATLTLSGLTVSGDGAASFLIGSHTCGGSVAPGDSCVVRLRYAPAAAAPESAVFSAATNAGAEAVVSLQGEGTTAPIGPSGPSGPTGDTGASGSTGATGSTGASGATGTTGPSGAQGPAGAQGPVGPAGAPGARGPAGRDARVRCTVRRVRTRTRVTCRVTFVARSARSSVRWTLTRGRRTYAHGMARVRARRATISIPNLRLPKGTYALRITGRRSAATIVVR